MEKEGLIRAMKFLCEDNGFFLMEIVTDRHPQIQKWLRENQPNTKHYFDVWHVAKGYL
jgi:solute carrier family 8 (sodium/calcium exchanger)